MSVNNSDESFSSISLKSSPPPTPGRIRQTETEVPNKRYWKSQWYALFVAFALSYNGGFVWKLGEKPKFRGGWIFLIQVAICYIFTSAPLMMLETALGQFSSQSPFTLFRNLAPISGGIPCVMALVLLIRSITNSVNSTYSLYLTGLSFSENLLTDPISSCDQQRLDCYDYTLFQKCAETANTEICKLHKEQLIRLRFTIYRRSPYEAYMAERIHSQNFSQGESPHGSVELPDYGLVICLFVVWTITLLICYNGHRFIEKLAVTAPIAIAVNFLILFGGLFFLPKTKSSKLEYLQADWKMMSDYEAWASAVCMGLNCANTASGGIIQISSLRRFSWPIRRTVVLVALTTLIVAFAMLILEAVYSVSLANMKYGTAQTADQPLEPFHAVLHTFSQGYIFSAIVHLAEFVLGWIAVVSSANSLITVRTICFWSVMMILRDKLIVTGKEKLYKRLRLFISLIALAIPSLLCAFLILLCGRYWSILIIYIEKMLSIALLFVAFCELVVVSHIYGFKRFIVDMKALTGGKFPQMADSFWWLNWAVISPLLFLTAFIILPTELTRTTVIMPEQIFETHDKIVKILQMYGILLIPVIVISIYSIVQIVQTKRRHLQWKVVLRPTAEWSPLEEKDRNETIHWERALRVRK